MIDWIVDNWTKAAFWLWVGIIILVILPPRWDPAVRWKERQQRKRSGDPPPEMDPLDLVLVGVIVMGLVLIVRAFV